MNELSCRNHDYKINYYYLRPIDRTSKQVMAISHQTCVLKPNASTKYGDNGRTKPLHNGNIVS